MLTVLDRAARHAIVLARPLSEVNHLASLGAKWPEAVGRRHIDRLLANRTPHRAHVNRKLPDSSAARKSYSRESSIDIQFNRYRIDCNGRFYQPAETRIKPARNVLPDGKAIPAAKGRRDDASDTR
jgi:hypothetical protein